LWTRGWRLGKDVYIILMFLESSTRTKIDFPNPKRQASDFTRAGFRHHDLYFIDGSCPPEPIARRFLEIAEAEPGVLAIHCKAGE